MSAVPVTSPAPPSATAPADGGQGRGSSNGKAARVFRWLAGAADWGQYGKHPWWSALLFGPAVAAVLLLAGVSAYRAAQPQPPAPAVQTPAVNPKYSGVKSAPGGSTARPRVSPSRPAPLPTAARPATASAAPSVTPSRTRSTGPATATSRPAPSRTARPTPSRTPRPTPSPPPSPSPPSPTPAPTVTTPETGPGT